MFEFFHHTVCFCKPFIQISSGNSSDQTHCHLSRILQTGTINPHSNFHDSNRKEIQTFMIQIGKKFKPLYDSNQKEIQTVATDEFSHR